tara:strand:+ start:51 stop:665 length:615 start_codon:yes stop_codon:yes gene_type:complete
VKFYKPSINYVDKENDADKYVITSDGTNYKINFGHGDENEVYFIENADSSVEYDRGYYTCNKKYERPIVEAPVVATPVVATPVVATPITWDRNTEIPYILDNYPIINRTNSTTASVTLAYSRPVKIHWVNVPMSYNKPVTMVDIAINPMLIKDHTDWGQVVFAQEKTQTITVGNLLPSQSYHLYIVLYSPNNKTWSSIYTFEIP